MDKHHEVLKPLFIKMYIYRKGGIMYRLSLTMILIQICISWGEVKVEKILETHNVNEYNQWILANQQKYINLEPVLISAVTDNQGGKIQHIIDYYQISGSRRSREIVSNDSNATYIDVSVSNTHNRLHIFKFRANEIFETIIKDSEGEVILSKPYAVSYLATDIYIESLNPEYQYTQETCIRVLNQDGIITDRLMGIIGIDRDQCYIPYNKTFAVFRGIPASSYSVNDIFFCLNNQGKKIWRKTFCGPSSIFISDDGSYVGLNHGDTTSVYLLNGTLFRRYTAPNNGNISMKGAFSDNGEWLAVGCRSKIRLFNNGSGELVWEEEKSLAKNDDVIRFIGIVGNLDYVVIISRSHMLYIYNVTGDLIHTSDLSLGLVTHKIPVREHGRIVRYNQIESHFQNWSAKIVDNLICITKNQKHPTKTRPLIQIVYAIIAQSMGGEYEKK